MSNRFGKSVRRSAMALLLAAGLVSGAAQATLLGRDLNGSPGSFEAYYDDVLLITWLKDANYAQTSGFDGDGLMTWSAANTWATTTPIYGLTGWRLARINGTGPVTTAHNCASGTAAACAASGNELGYMHYIYLGGGNNTGTQTIPQPPDGPAGDATFDNIQLDSWSGTEFNSTLAWALLFDNGVQSNFGMVNESSAWAVRPGDVIAAAPEPASVLLIGAGMLGLGWSRRRGRRR